MRRSLVGEEVEGTAAVAGPTVVIEAEAIAVDLEEVEATVVVGGDFGVVTVVAVVGVGSKGRCPFAVVLRSREAEFISGAANPSS